MCFFNVKMETKMKNELKMRILCVCLLLATTVAHATTRSVLFIGNSYIFTNNMPLMLQKMATAMGDTLIYDESDPGGYTLMQHTTNTTTLSLLKSRKWDLVVLQELSQRTSNAPVQVAAEVYPYARRLDSLIKDNDSCTQTMFLMTWAHETGDPVTCPTYPPVCSYMGMQYRMRESYLEMAHDNMAVVAPVGAAWKAFRDSVTSPTLYMTDKIHPELMGSYLEACVLYSSIFHKRVYGCSYTAGLLLRNVEVAQRTSDRTTMDSLALWQQYGHYPYADFEKTVAGNTATFKPDSALAAEYIWHFGDGAVDTVAAPVHFYMSSGTYTVTYTALNKCFSETVSDTVRIVSALGVENAANANSSVRIMQQGNGSVIFQLPDHLHYDVLEVMDSKGARIRMYTGPDLQRVADKFVPGFYVILGYTHDRKYTFRDKMIIY